MCGLSEIRERVMLRYQDLKVIRLELLDDAHLAMLEDVVDYAKEALAKEIDRLQAAKDARTIYHDQWAFFK